VGSVVGSAVVEAIEEISGVASGVASAVIEAGSEEDSEVTEVVSLVIEVGSVVVEVSATKEEAADLVTDKEDIKAALLRQTLLAVPVAEADPVEVMTIDEMATVEAEIEAARAATEILSVIETVVTKSVTETEIATEIVIAMEVTDETMTTAPANDSTTTPDMTIQDKSAGIDTLVCVVVLLHRTCKLLASVGWWVFYGDMYSYQFCENNLRLSSAADARVRTLDLSNPRQNTYGDIDISLGAPPLLHMSIDIGHHVSG
jgi:hypothetical protein